MSAESISRNSKESKDPEAVAVRETSVDNVYCPEVDTSGIDERKLMRRIDWHVVPWLAVLYLLNFLDRGSIGNARVRTVYYESMTSAKSNKTHQLPLLTALRDDHRYRRY